MIQFKNITLQYEGRNLIQALNEHIRKGEKVVIAGPSGSGKSSLLSLVTGFLSPNCGEILLDGESVDVYGKKNKRNLIAWVPQEFYLPYRCAEELLDVLLHFKANREIGKPSEYYIRHFLDEVGLSPAYWTKSFTEMSGGERQRLLIVVALLQKKPLLLLDEPTSALDAHSVTQVITLLQKQNMTMLAVSHDDEFIHSFDRIINLTGNE